MPRIVATLRWRKSPDTMVRQVEGLLKEVAAECGHTLDAEQREEARDAVRVIINEYVEDNAYIDVETF